MRLAAPIVPVLLAGQVLAQAGGDAARGAEIWLDCSGCHQIGEGAANQIGPHLNGLFGRHAAAVPDFPYSGALQRAANRGLVWDHETLDAFLENPDQIATNTRMSYPGLPDPQERADLLAFLRQYSASPQNIPESAPTAAFHDPDLDPAILDLVGDPAYGEYLSGECTSCHQAGGGDSGIPSIVAWPEDLFVIAMHAYKEGRRRHPVMEMMASRLSNEEIAALAAYFATVTPR